MKNLLELSGRIDVQESFKLLKSKEVFCDNNNGAIKETYKVSMIVYFKNLHK